MALNIDPASIAEALRRNVESWTPTVERGEVGRVTETADGVARVAGSAPRHGERAPGVPRRGLRPGVQPGRGRDRLHHPGRVRQDRGGRPRQADGHDPVDAGRRRLPRARRGRARPPARRQGPDPVDRAPQPGGAGAERRLAPAGEGAALHGHLGDRRHDGHRARPAPADHRRPPDRQDRRGGRRDHRPARALGHRPRGEVHLRGRSDRRPPRCPRSSRRSARTGRSSTPSW